MSVGDAVIADSRRDESTVASAQWRQAGEAFAWAAALDRRDLSVTAKQLDCEAQIDRIAAQSRLRTNPTQASQLYQQAIDKFRRAARLDPGSPDPYLGLSRIYVYGLADVDQAAAAIHDAESRGHTPGWREHAQLGDGYLRRAEKDRREADGSRARRQRSDELSAMTRARDDFAKCVEEFAPILDRGRSKANYEFCTRRLDAVTRALDAVTAEQP